MGIQIHIKSKDMLKAGWTEVTEVQDYYEYDAEGNEHPAPYNLSVFTKGDVVLHSYFNGGFCADCNDWGSNKTLFKELGLFDIPHILS